LIPEDPLFVPDEPRRNRARARFAEIAPNSDDITADVKDHVVFFDCGTNFETIRCPSCSAEVPMEWWQGRIKDDSIGESFKLSTYPMPCCQAQHTLHELTYDWPQGFGRFALDAMNPDIGELDGKYKTELEGILGTSLRVIYQHL
jgi:hypothetical protein